MRPIHFLQRKRNCHIKFMSIDGQVAIMGNANMDSLSWFHSQVSESKMSCPIFDVINIVGDQCDDRFAHDCQRLDGCFV